MVPTPHVRTWLEVLPASVNQVSQEMVSSAQISMSAQPLYQLAVRVSSVGIRLVRLNVTSVSLVTNPTE